MKMLTFKEWLKPPNNTNWESCCRCCKNKNSITPNSINTVKFHMSSGSHKVALAAESSRCPSLDSVLHQRQHQMTGCRQGLQNSPGKPPDALIEHLQELATRPGDSSRLLRRRKGQSGQGNETKPKTNSLYVHAYLSKKLFLVLMSEGLCI